MIDVLLNPALVLVLGALPLPLLPAPLRRAYLVALPLASLGLLCWLPAGDHGAVNVFGMALNTLRLDKLSFVFGVIFHIAALLTAIYAWYLRDALQQVATLVYAGAGIGALLAGDLVTLFVYWELTAIASVFLIWARRTERAYRVGLRYLVIQVSSGLLLLAGIVLRWQQTGSVAFERFELEGAAAWLIFLAFGVKCAFPLLHGWLQDAYPEATVVGTVALSVFTTKLAVYALARGFPGVELLIYVGAAMTVFPIFYAVIENDLRRVLAYSLINQLGFMVVGIGIGTELALNGAVAHAFAHILYKALLFMSMGAVLLRVGTVNGSELGGLYKSMPQTAALCIVGAASISAFPLFSGFVTKSLVIDAVTQEHRVVIWLMLLFASAGVFHHAGIKVPYFAFFAHDSGKRCEEAPLSMRLAMGVAAALCIGIGVWPQPLYALLPYPVEFAPYTAAHVLTQLQLLMLAAVAFAVLMRTGIYPPELRSVNLDFDWLYRRAGPALWRSARASAGHVWGAGARLVGLLGRAGGQALAPARPDGWLAMPWSTNAVVGWIVLLLSAFLVLALS